MDELDEDELVLVSVLIVVTAAVVLERMKLNTNYRHYVERSGLLHPRRETTPWKRLMESGTSRTFINLIGFDRETFDYLLSFFGPVYNSRSPYEYASSADPARRHLDAAGCLALILFWYSTTADDAVLCLIFGTTPAVTALYRDFGLKILAEILPLVPEAKIAFPNPGEYESIAAVIALYEPMVKNVIGFLDGCNLKLVDLEDKMRQNGYYNGWEETVWVSNLFVFLPSGVICFAALNYPGSWHDAKVRIFCVPPPPCAVAILTHAEKFVYPNLVRFPLTHMRTRDL
jgi:hypothetical protein